MWQVCATNQVDSVTAWSQDGVDATASLWDYLHIPGAGPGWEEEK